MLTDLPLNAAFCHRENMENPDEPLNLTVKKCPIAIVPPLPVPDKRHQIKFINADHRLEDFVPRKAVIDVDRESDDAPQDLSIKKNGEPPDPVRKTINNDKNFANNYLPHNNEDNEKFFPSFKDNYHKNDFADNLLKNSFDLKSNIFRDVYKMTDFYDNLTNKNLTPSENVYLNVLNHLTEQKFLAALYVNSVLSSMQHPPNVQEASFDRSNRRNTAVTPDRNSPTKNSILNNLLNKKPPPSSRATNFELIKNETNSHQEDAVKIVRSQADHKNNMDAKNNQDANNAADKKKPHIKKPLNAFMLYMKEMRAKVVAECTLKESAAINQILGRKWHALGREEQAKYYELARRERQLHMQLYPDWSSRANATRGKKRKRKQDPADGGNSMKKCRARYGLDQQNQWCKPCSPENTSLGSGSSGVHPGLLHAAGGAASAQSPQEPTYVNL